jgi:hypothetical protein
MMGTKIALPEISLNVQVVAYSRYDVPSEMSDKTRTFQAGYNMCYRPTVRAHIQAGESDVLQSSRTDP